MSISHPLGYTPNIYGESFDVDDDYSDDDSRCEGADDEYDSDASDESLDKGSPTVSPTASTSTISLESPSFRKPKLSKAFRSMSEVLAAGADVLATPVKAIRRSSTLGAIPYSEHKCPKKMLASLNLDDDEGSSIDGDSEDDYESCASEDSEDDLNIAYPKSVLAERHNSRRNPLRGVVTGVTDVLMTPVKVAKKGVLGVDHGGENKWKKECGLPKEATKGEAATILLAREIKSLNL